MAAISFYSFQILLGAKINSFVLQTLLNVFCGWSLGLKTCHKKVLKLKVTGMYCISSRGCYFWLGAS